MYSIIWKYRVKPGRVVEFEKLYNPNGAWAGLFGKSHGYLGTELLHDKEDPERYLTIDRWISQEAYDDFKRLWKREYDALDAECEGLILEETLVGKYEGSTGGVQ